MARIKDMTFTSFIEQSLQGIAQQHGWNVQEGIAPIYSIVDIGESALLVYINEHVYAGTIHNITYFFNRAFTASVHRGKIDGSKQRIDIIITKSIPSCTAVVMARESNIHILTNVKKTRLATTTIENWITDLMHLPAIPL